MWSLQCQLGGLDFIVWARQSLEVHEEALQREWPFRGKKQEKHEGNPLNLLSAFASLTFAACGVLSIIPQSVSTWDLRM